MTPNERMAGPPDISNQRSDFSRAAHCVVSIKMTETSQLHGRGFFTIPTLQRFIHGLKRPWFFRNNKKGRVSETKPGPFNTTNSYACPAEPSTFSFLCLYISISA